MAFCVLATTSNGNMLGTSSNCTTVVHRLALVHQSAVVTVHPNVFLLKLLEYSYLFLVH